jgi:hypothetical protein
VLLRIAGAVARAAPIGVFALIAHAAGTMSVEALGRVQVYFLLYIGTALLLSLWVLPGLIAVLTPLPARRVLAHSQDALVTAFATGSLLIVIPLMDERSKELLNEVGLHNPATESAVNLMVPINFNLPNMGKLLSLVFVLFAGWFSGNAVSVDQYPLFLAAGLLSFFGEVVVALPFLLDLMRVPADFFQLFLPVDTVTGRFGTLLAAVHTITQALLTAAAVTGAIRWRLGALARYGAVSLGLALAVFWGSRLYFEHVMPQEYRAYQQLCGWNSRSNGRTRVCWTRNGSSLFCRRAPGSDSRPSRRAAPCAWATRPTACRGPSGTPRGTSWASTSISPISSPPSSASGSSLSTSSRHGWRRSSTTAAWTSSWAAWR